MILFFFFFKARWMRGASRRSSDETYKHDGSGKSPIASRFRPLGHRSVRLRVYDVFTLFFSGVAPLFLWKKNDPWLLHSLRSILGSSHPLPTTERRLTPQRPETVRKAVAVSAEMCASLFLILVTAGDFRWELCRRKVETCLRFLQKIKNKMEGLQSEAGGTWYLFINLLVSFYE